MFWITIATIPHCVTQFLECFSCKAFGGPKGLRPEIRIIQSLPILQLLIKGREREEGMEGRMNNVYIQEEE